MSIKSKTIIHVVQHLSPGGLEALALNMLAFSSPHQKVLIVSLEGTKQESVLKWSKLKSVENQLIFLNKPSGYSVKTLIQLVKLFLTLKPSVVHTHHIGPILYGSVAARLAGVKARIHTEHDAWHLSDQKHRALQNLALKIAKPCVVADALLVKQRIHQHFDYQDVRVIKNGIDCEKFTTGSKHLARQLFGLPVQSTIIGTAGRLEQVKGHDILINAMALLPNHIQLVIAGDGSQRIKLEQQVQQLGLSRRVTFLGLVDDMTRFYQTLDLFCLPSRSEGFPLSTLEAQACDIVTLASNVGATKETLCPSTGVLFESENSQQLAASVKTALNKPVKASPRQFVLKHNDIRDMMRAYEILAEEKSA